MGIYYIHTNGAAGLQIALARSTYRRAFAMATPAGNRTLSGAIAMRLMGFVNWVGNA